MKGFGEVRLRGLGGLWFDEHGVKSKLNISTPNLTALILSLSHTLIILKL